MSQLGLTPSPCYLCLDVCVLLYVTCYMLLAILCHLLYATCLLKLSIWKLATTFKDLFPFAR